MSLKQKSKNKNIRDSYRGINEFKKGYQPSTNLVKYEHDLLADFHNILDRWKNSFCPILDAYGVNDVSQTERHTAEPLVRGNSSFEV
jgi:hypothetical protein